ncbi:MAG: 23S rRNA (uracil(1939)-C(5))-methyltransferase RlmD [Bacillota bacterium]
MAKKVLPVKKGERVKLDIDGLTHNGDGVGRYCGLAVFVPGSVPGDSIEALVVQLKKGYAIGRLVEVLEKSKVRRETDCEFFSSCGGCRLLNVNYREQLRLKTALVRDSLTRIAGLEDVPVRETLVMDCPWHYRNKAHFQVEEGANGCSLGFYEEGTHNLSAFFRGEGNSGCLLVDRDLNRVASAVEDLLNRHGRDLYRSPGRKFFRHVVLRKGYLTGEIMAVLVTGSGDWPGQRAFVEQLSSREPGITSVIRNINDGPRGIIMGSESRVLTGRGYITDQLEDLKFIISPSSFYQINSSQTLVLYRKALEYSGLEVRKGLTVVDAYSGVGTIALFMARHAKKVYGLEVVREAVKDAGRNAELNKIDNVEFHFGEVEKLLPSMAARGLRPDVVVLDPPRKGCRPEVLDAVAEMGTPTLVYVSCDPGTLARDLGHLSGRGYCVEEVQPVDMFPWTHHIESIILLQRRNT